MDKLTWPEGFMDIGNRTFDWVYTAKRDFVDFTLHEMETPSGLFKKWKSYCKIRMKKESEEK